MARPKSLKRICSEPGHRYFVPAGTEEAAEVLLTLDEYETIRLIDYENISREECAKRMNIPRTTAQDVYNSAKEKIADCIINGKILHIEGGNICVCDGSAGCENCSKTTI